MEILDDMHVGDTVEGLTEVNEGSKDSMGLLEVKRGVDKVKKFNQIVNNGGTFHSILARIHIGQDEREEPVSNEPLIHFAKEESS